MTKIQLTEAQEKEYLKKKVDTFKEELKALEDKHEMHEIAFIDSSIAGIFPKKAIVMKEKDVGKE